MKPDWEYASGLSSLATLSTKITFFPSPPNLQFLAGNDAQLKEIAKLIHSVFSTRSSILFSENDLSELEKSICLFINELCKTNRKKSLEPSKSFQNLLMSNTSDLKNVYNTLKSIKIENEELKSKNADLNFEINRLKEELNEQKDVANERNLEYRHSLQRINQLRQDYEKRVKYIQAEKEEIEKRMHYCVDKTNQDSYALKRNKETINNLSLENSSLKEEIQNNIMKLHSKNKKIDLLKSDIENHIKNEKAYNVEREKMLAILNGYKVRLLRSNASISQSSTTTIEPDVTANTVLEELERNIKTQALEIQQLYNQRTSLVTLVTKLRKSNDSYEKLLDNLSTKNNELLALKDRLLNENDNLRKAITAKSKENDNREPLLNVNNDLKEIENILNPRENESVIDSIHRIIKSNEKSTEMNKQLVSLIKSQIIKIGSFIADYEEMPVDIRNQIIKQKDLYMSVIQKCHEEIKGNDVIDIFKIEDTSFMFLATEIQNNAVICRLLDDYKMKCTEYEKAFKLLSNHFKIRGSVMDVVTEIIDDNNENESAVKRILLSIDKSDSKKPMEDILNSIIEMNRIVMILDVAVRRITDFSGNISDLPQFICEYITNMKEELDAKQENNSEIELSDEQLTKSNSEFDAVLKENLKEKDKKIDDLQKQIYSLEIKNNNIRRKMEEASVKYQTMKEKITGVKNELVISESKISDLEKEKRDLLSRMDLCEKKCDEQIRKISDDYNTEIESIKSTMKEKHQMEIKQLNDRIDEKSSRLSQLKRSVKNMIKYYDNLLSEQKETTNAIRQQNEYLNSSVLQMSSVIDERDNTGNEEINKMKLIISSLRTENDTLRMKNSSLSSQYSTIDFGNESSVCDNNRASLFNEFLANLCKALRINASVVESDTMEMIEKKIDEICMQYFDNKLLNEWSSWSKELYEFITKAACFGKDPSVIRQAITDVVHSSSSRVKLVRKLELMRYQKKILNILPDMPQLSSKSVPSIRSLTLTVIFTKAIMSSLHK